MVNNFVLSTNTTQHNKQQTQSPWSDQDEDFQYLTIKIPKTSATKAEKLFDKVAEEAILIQSDDEEDFVFYRASKTQDSAVVTPES